MTNQALLAWFKGRNAHLLPQDQVWPFNFLLTFQAKSKVEMAATDPEALNLPAWKKLPKPASRYSSDLGADRPEVFDRTSGEEIPWEWLRSYRRALAAHHLHSETKFRGGEDNARGTLVRRHVEAWAVIPIGKEADNLEEREALGEEEDTIEWDLTQPDRARLLADVEEMIATYGISDRSLIERAHVSRHTLADLRRGRRVKSTSLLRLARAAEELRLEGATDAAKRDDWLRYARELMDAKGGRNKLADLLGVSRPYLGRVLNGQKQLSAEMVIRLGAYRYT